MRSVSEDSKENVDTNKYPESKSKPIPVPVLVRGTVGIEERLELVDNSKAAEELDSSEDNCVRKDEDTNDDQYHDKEHYM